MFSKLSNIISKKTKSKIDTDIKEHEIEESVEKDTVTAETSKGLSSTDMVFGGGILVIIGVGIFMILGNNTDTSKEEKVTVSTEQHSQASPKENQLKKPWEYPENETLKEEKPMNDFVDEEKKLVSKKMENKAPFAEYVKPQVLSSEPVEDTSTEELMAPPESYENAYIKKVEGNQTKKRENLKVKELPLKKPLSKEDTNAQKHLIEKKDDTFVCRLLNTYSNMKGKEIIYYKKSSHAISTYIPVYKSNNWDQSGIMIKDKFIATAVDIEHKMVEVAKDQWIPALEFASCTLVEEH